MIKLDVQNQHGETVSNVEIDPDQLGKPVNKQLLHDVVLMHLANQRRGTHSTKRRGEVSGSTKKLFRQKGTGNARVGSRRTNKRRGGGTAKGPKPRDYYYRMPKKAVRSATRMAIRSRFEDNEVVLVDELTVEEIKTKNVIEILGNLNLADVTCLIGNDNYDTVLYKSARNIPGIEVMPVPQWNAYTVLKPKKLLVTQAALDLLLGKETAEEKGEAESSEATEEEVPKSEASETATETSEEENKSESAESSEEVKETSETSSESEEDKKDNE